MYLFYLEIIECSGGKVRLLTLLMSVLEFIVTVDPFVSFFC